MGAAAQLDKALETAISEGHGTITIRVVVLVKGMAPSAADGPEEILDAEPDEVIPDTEDKRPTASFLEEPKRGRQCCVFLINGQRQHFWDNTFIVRDLDLKYLRNRMIVVVDCDGLKPEAIAELMQGSRHQFYDGTVCSALESRVVATLKGDPDLRRLEEDAEDEISSLSAGDEAVKSALDQLIEAHHDAGGRVDHGHTEAGDSSRDEGAAGGLVQTVDVVVEGDNTLGLPASGPVLQLRPDVTTIRLKPNEAKKVTIFSKPDLAWKDVSSHVLTLDPPVKEMILSRSSNLAGEEATLRFAVPDDFDQDEYPIETTLRSTATFKGLSEPRFLEKRVVINVVKGGGGGGNPQELKDDPTFIKVTSRQPIQIVVGGPDVHVKIKWDGKDELLHGNPPKWSMRVTCESPSVEPQTFLTHPTGGRFELLIQAAPGLTAGEQLKFDVEAVGPGTSLATAFLADVIEPLSPRKIAAKILGGGQRRPPYDLRYVKKEQWDKETCWGQVWSGEAPGSFEPPSSKSPLTIFINQDMDLLAVYRDKLLGKKLVERTIQERINKYTAHVAFHLYQMYQKAETAPKDAPPQSEELMRDEIQRVARTLIRLMEVSQ